LFIIRGTGGSCHPLGTRPPPIYFSSSEMGGVSAIRWGLTANRGGQETCSRRHLSAVRSREAGPTALLLEMLLIRFTTVSVWSVWEEKRNEKISRKGKQPSPLGEKKCHGALLGQKIGHARGDCIRKAPKSSPPSPPPEGALYLGGGLRIGGSGDLLLPVVSGGELCLILPPFELQFPTFPASRPGSCGKKKRANVKTQNGLSNNYLHQHTM